MAGHGYLALGLISLLPAAVFVAAVAQDGRFRRGMPPVHARRCWMCMLSVFTFPLTCGFVGQHKRQMTLLVDEVALLEGAVFSAHWDRYFLLFQLHLAWIVVSYVLWRQIEAPPPPPSSTAEGVRQKRARSAAWQGLAGAPPVRGRGRASR